MKKNQFSKFGSDLCGKNSMNMRTTLIPHELIKAGLGITFFIRNDQMYKSLIKTKKHFNCIFSSLEN